MRLFYQTLGMSRGSKSGGYGQLLQRLITDGAAPGTQIDIFGLSPHRAVADQYRYLEFQDTAEILENGLRAEREGYDAFLIGNIFQPGLHELRELLNIPVLGLAESSVQMACLMGPSFSLINVNPKFNRRIVDGIRLQGLESRMVSVEMMTVERPGVFDLAQTDPDVVAQIVTQFVDTAHRALDKGAEVLIPAGGSLMAVLIKAGLAQVDGAPVLNGITALIKTAEMAVQMRRLTGMFTSKRLTYAPPTGKLLEDVRKSYGDEVYPAAS
jgi:allantoin racemase